MGIVANVLRFFFGEPTPREVPPPHALDGVCAKYACTYERSVFPTGEVQMRLIREDATLSAVAPTTRLVVPAPAKGGAMVTLPSPLRLTANTALNFASASAVTTMYVSAVGFAGI